MKKGDIVFNHKQSEELFKNGYVTSGGGRGRALAEGTALSSGSGKFYGGASKYNTSTKLPKKSTNNVQKAVDKAAKTVTKAADNVAKTAESALDKLSNLFDWVSIKLDKAKEATDKATRKIELAVGLGNKQSANSSALTAIRSEISANQSAYNAYMNQANSTASKFGLSSDLISKIQNGSYSIVEYDEDTNKKIDEYKKWYDAAQACLDTITELEDKERELAQERLTNISDYYDAVSELYSSQQDIHSSNNDVRDAYGYSATSDAVKQEVKENIKLQEQIFNNLQKKLSDYQTEFNNLVAKGYIQKNSDAWYEATATIYDMQNEVNEANVALAEFQQELQEIQYQENQNLIDGIGRVIDTLSNVMSLKESRDEQGTEEEFRKQLDENNKQIEAYYKDRQDKLKEMAIYDVNSSAYQDLAEDISKIDSEIFGLLEDNEQLKESIREVRWTGFNDQIEEIQNLTEETEAFKDLLNEDAFFDKTGGLTDDGLAYIALVGQQINQQQQIIANYTEGLHKLDEELQNGVISTEKYEEEQQNFLEGIRDAIGNVDDYKNELIDLYKEQMQAEVDALDESISKRKEAQKQKEAYYEYDKKIRTQTKDVNAIKAQIAALEGVTNAAALAEKKRLEAQLAEEQSALDDTKREHANDMIDQGYDAMSDDINQALEDTLYEITQNADKQQQVVANMLNNIVSMYGTAYGKIQEIIKNTGWVGSGGFNQNVSDVGTSSGASNQVGNATKNPGQIKPDSSTDVETGPINSNPNIDKIEEDISTPIDTSNRKVAQLNLTPTSLNLTEGQQGVLSATVRPTDAKNKTLSWTSSNPSIATVNESGTVNAKKVGSVVITCSTTDGSSLVKTCKVTVKAKPAPPKPPTTQKPSNDPNKGDGTPKVGDKVKFVSGYYYYDSYGSRPTGSKHHGEELYITYMNPKAPYPIHLGTKKKPGYYSDLGWVKLSQIKGYRRGSNFIPTTQLAQIDENNKEELVYRYGGKNYSILTKGSGVIPATPTKNLMEFGTNPQQYLQKQFGNISAGKEFTQINVDIQSLMSIDKVTQDSVPDLKKLVPQLADAVAQEIAKEVNRLK